MMNSKIIIIHNIKTGTCGWYICNVNVVTFLRLTGSESEDELNIVV